MPSERDSEVAELLDAVSGGIIVLDERERVVRWNAWMESAAAIPAQQAMGRELGELFPGLDLKRLPAAVRAALESSASTLITHALNPSLLPLHTRSSRPLAHDITVAPVHRAAGRQCLVFITDVTLTTQRERYLRNQQNARYDAVVGSATDVIITIDDQGRISSANPAAIAQLGFQSGELAGVDAATLFHTKDEWAATWREASDVAHAAAARELVAYRKDGSLTYLEASASRWKTGARYFVTVILRDINGRRASDAALRASEAAARTSAAALRELNQTLEERVVSRTAQLMAAEEALRQSQKMEAIGNLTGGMAHDFNNLLHVIGANLQLLKREVAGNEVAEKRLKNAMDGVLRSSKLSSQLLSFARRQPLEPKVLNIGRFIQDMDDLIRKSVGEGITVETRVDAGLWNTLIDPGNVENALLNLAINARDAMDGHGKLTIEAGNVVLDAAYARAHEEVMRGDYVQVQITDTGTGIAPEIVAKVFEPFFTTKSDGKGTGLGLSMVYGFVRQSGGHIEIHSVVGQGTTIKLFLPRSLHAEERLVDMDAMPVVGGNEMVLIAEDTESVREAVVAMFNDLGYRVLKAKDAHGAMTIIESGMPIDVLFTDVVMPGPLNVMELARKARERIPDLAIIFTSGYSQDAIVHGGRLDEDVDLLTKPYTREALARKLRHALSKTGRGRIPAHRAVDLDA